MKNLQKNNSPGTGSAPDGLNDTLTGESIPPEPPDEVLVGQARSGGMDAFGKLIERHQDRLFNAMLRMLGNYDDAQELAQEAFVRALQGLKRFRGNAAFCTWLFRIGINLAINHRRRRQTVRFTSLHADRPGLADSQAHNLADMAEASGPSPVQVAQTREDHRLVVEALAELESDARAVVVLRDIEQFNYSDIARILEVPVGTVKSRLFRARSALRARLLDDSPSDDKQS